MENCEFRRHRASCWSVENSSKLHAVVKGGFDSLGLKVNMEIHFREEQRM